MLRTFYVRGNWCKRFWPWLLSGNIRCRPMQIFARVPLGGESNGIGVVDDGNNFIVGAVGGYFFENVWDKAINITWRYATPCWPVNDCKMNDLEWPWVVISSFMSKSVFGQQGCRALTFALARLSCYRHRQQQQQQHHHHHHHYHHHHHTRLYHHSIFAPSWKGLQLLIDIFQQATIDIDNYVM